jgi:hypothetical protein
VEAAGIEPVDDFDATAEPLCDCENCQQCRAAYALHSECFKSHFLASLDTDLQNVIESWEGVPVAIRAAINALLKGRSN